METAFEELKERLGEIHDLDRASSLLGWDQQVDDAARAARPSAPSSWRRSSRIAHEAFTSDEIGRLLDELAPLRGRARVRLVRGEPDPASSAATGRRRDACPSELRAEMSRAGVARACRSGSKARQENDFSQFLPALRANFELRRRYVECFDDYDEPYDVLLDDFEPGMKTAEVRAVFDDVKEEQVPLVAAVARGRRAVRSAARTFPIEGQKEFELEVIERFGFDAVRVAARPDRAPVRDRRSRISDIRLTTRYFEDNLDGLFGTMHE